MGGGLDSVLGPLPCLCSNRFSIIHCMYFVPWCQTKARLWVNLPEDANIIWGFYSLVQRYMGLLNTLINPIKEPLHDDGILADF